MTRTTGDRLPEPLLRMLDGDDPAGGIGFTIELLTVDEAGWPRAALLSVGEVVAIGMAATVEVGGHGLAAFACDGSLRSMSNTARAACTSPPLGPSGFCAGRQP